MTKSILIHPHRIAIRPRILSGFLFFICTIGHAQSKPAQAKDSVQDIVAIQYLINAYAHDADRRLTEQQADLFTKNATIEIYHAEPGPAGPDTVLRGRDAFIAGFSTLKKYDVTMHFNGQETIHVNGDSATGEVYCLAHHFWTSGGKKMMMIMGIRYYDQYVKEGATWRFAQRKLIFDWVDTRPSSPM